MLTHEQRARILQHLEHGWKLPDSLVLELWSAYESLARSQPGAAVAVGHDEPGAAPERAVAPGAAPRRPER